ncbi:MAG: hypothetical protein ACD_26C00089G0001 [uncultured bacterium]|nr:MAG: hypothetical protein ACD_26C00089G0001 [uncultured bacterium]
MKKILKDSIKLASAIGFYAFIKFFFERKELAIVSLRDTIVYITVSYLILFTIGFILSFTVYFIKSKLA